MKEDVRTDLIETVCTRCPYYGECPIDRDCAAFIHIGEIIENLSRNYSDQ